MAFEYRVTVPDDCTCYWREKPYSSLADEDRDQLKELFPFPLDGGASIMARLSTMAGCPQHEPAKPWPIEACRTCGAGMIWTTTAARNDMPVNAAPDVDGTIKLTWGADKLTVHSKVVRGARILALLRGSLHTSHFATCPQADRWRTRR